MALATRADAFGEDILAIADNTKNDTHTTTYADGVERTSPNTEWISRSRLRVDARKWLASKHHPKKYGDMVTQKVTGADGGRSRSPGKGRREIACCPCGSRRGCGAVLTSA